MTAGLKTSMIAALVALGMVPVATMAWHGGPHHGYGPGYQEACDWHPQARHRAPGCAVAARTFGMTEGEARDFMRDVKAVIGVTANQEKAFGAVETAFANLAKVRFSHYEHHAKVREMAYQEYLQHKSAFMHENTQAFDAYVKARGQLEKVLDAQQMQRFDEIVTTGRLLDRPKHHARRLPPPKP